MSVLPNCTCVLGSDADPLCPRHWVQEDPLGHSRIAPTAPTDGRAECGAVKDTNPKDAIGDKKVPLTLLSPIASAHWALAQYAGMSKYGAWNWRATGVRASVYISAIKRHIDGYTSGEQHDPLDGTHHLGNIMACAAILLEAEAIGNLTDDRPPKVDLRFTYAFVEKQMQVLREQYATRKPKHWTIKDSTNEQT